MLSISKKLVQICALALLGSLALVVSSPGYAQVYLGEACWLVNTEGSESEGEDYLKLAVFDIGDNHFTMNGFSFSSDDESTDERMVLSGNAEIFGEDQVVINLNGTVSNDEELTSASVSAKLSLSTLGGPFEIIGTILDKISEELVQGAEVGTLTITECPAL